MNHRPLLDGRTKFTTILTQRTSYNINFTMSRTDRRFLRVFSTSIESLRRSLDQDSGSNVQTFWLKQVRGREGVYGFTHLSFCLEYVFNLGLLSTCGLFYRKALKRCRSFIDLTTTTLTSTQISLILPLFSLVYQNHDTSKIKTYGVRR